MVYGELLRLPGELLTPEATDTRTNSQFVKDLKNHFHSLKPVQMTRQGKKKTFVFKVLNTTSHVFLRHPPPLTSFADDLQRTLLRPTSHRQDNRYILERQNHHSLDIDGDSATQEDTNQQPGIDLSVHDQDKVIDEPTSSSNQTRIGRRVRFPDRLQGGFA